MEQLCNPFFPHRPILANRYYTLHSEKQEYHNIKTSCQESSSAFTTYSKTIANEPEWSTGESCEIEKSASNIVDTFTQTSKTILQLAQMDAEVVFPDSLNSSPKNISYSNDNQKRLDEDVQTIHDVDRSEENVPISCYCVQGSVGEHNNSLSFIRKSRLLKLLESQEQTAEIPALELSDNKIVHHIFPDKSLTRAFLNKKKQESYELHHSSLLQNSSNVLSIDPHSNVISQTQGPQSLKIEDAWASEESPGNYSQHLVDMYHPNVISNDFYHNKEQAPGTRFSVKHIKEKEAVNCSRPIKYFCEPIKFTKNRSSHTQDNVSHSSNTPRAVVEFYSSPWQKRAHHRRRSSSFMSSTFASEQRNQAQVMFLLL